jgi:hypothetical protein
MIIWLDAQLSPAIASWMSLEFSVSAIAVRDLGLRDAKDQAIFSAARQANAVVMTKDIDFVHLVEQSGVPQQAEASIPGYTFLSRLPRGLQLVSLDPSCLCLGGSTPCRARCLDRRVSGWQVPAASFPLNKALPVFPSPDLCRCSQL